MSDQEVSGQSPINQERSKDNNTYLVCSNTLVYKNKENSFIGPQLKNPLNHLFVNLNTL